MTPEAQRILIAIEVWRRIGCHHWAEALAEAYKRHGDAADLTGVPDYPNDLNACHEMEKVLTIQLPSAPNTESEKSRYVIFLRIMCGEKGCVIATAARRAEAFLKAIGKWEEAP